MKVLVLSPYSYLLKDTIVAEGDDYDWRPETCEISDWPDSDWVVSFGYRKIIPHHVIERFQGQIINIHGSILPWNKGAHPNFWSWFDDTPKGVTIHRIADAIDGGEILARFQFNHMFSSFREPVTLKTSYDDLLIAGGGLFARSWRRIKNNTIEKPAHIFDAKGSYHRSVDIEKFFHFMTAGWDTSVEEVMAIGDLYNGQ